MRSELWILHGLALALSCFALALVAWFALRARRSGTALPRGLAPQVLLLVAVLLVSVNGLLAGRSPAWVGYTLVGASVALAAVGMWRMWRLGPRGRDAEPSR